MTSSSPAPRRALRPILAVAVVGVVVGALVGSVAPAAAQPPTLDALLARFAALPGLEAEFTEEKTMDLLAVPVRSEGRIYFAGRPDRLMRRVTAPDPSAALIAGGQLRMRSGGRTESIDIEGNPTLRGFVDSFRAVLAGDRAALERFYEAELTARADAGEDAWELRLAPRDAGLRRFLRSITMRGSGVSITEMVMLEVSGDRTLTRFRNVDTARRFTPAEARRVFAL